MAGLSVPRNPPLVPKIGYSYLGLGTGGVQGAKSDDEIGQGASAGGLAGRHLQIQIQQFLITGAVVTYNHAVLNSLCSGA
jgi:hypothetical protein